MSEPVGSRRIFQRLSGGGWGLTFPDDGVMLEARYTRREFSKLLAEVTVRVEWKDAKTFDGTLGFTTLDLTSQSARETFARHLDKRDGMPANAFDWTGAIDELAIRVNAGERDGGDRPIVLDDASETVSPDFDVYGLKIPSDAASLLIAHGDSMKSMLLLLILGTLAQRGHRVLYCDWEWSAGRHRARKRRMFGPERLDNLRYLRCTAPLTVEHERLLRYCDQERIEVVGIDSIGLGADGKLAEDETARRFYRALNQLRPAICAAHIPKASVSTDPKVDPVGAIGSVFWHNLARLTWIVKKQSATDDVVTVACCPAKQNDGKRLEPVAIEFTFGERIDFRTVEAGTVAGVAERMPLWRRIKDAVKAGPMTLGELSADLGAERDSIRKAVRRYEDLFVDVPSISGETRIALKERRIA